MPLRMDELRPDKGATRRKHRVGRGPGSGSGKTAGRGTKGQKARSGGGVRPGFEGGQNPIQKRMPYKRGFTNVWATPWETVNIGTLGNLEVDGAITPEVLANLGLIRSTRYPVKILGNGELDAAVTVHAHAFSKSARERIEQAGGSVETLERTDEWLTARPRTRRRPLSREMKAMGVGKVGGPSRREALAQIAEREGKEA